MPDLHRRLARARRGGTDPDSWKQLGGEPSGEAERVLAASPGILRRRTGPAQLHCAGAVHAPVVLLGASEYQEGIERCHPMSGITILGEAIPGTDFLVTLKDGTPIGRIGTTGALARAISRADAVLGAKITSCGREDSTGQLSAPRVAVITGPGGTRLNKAWFATRAVHSILLSGEQHFQISIRKLSVGEPVTLTQLPADLQDESSILAVNRRVEPLGYMHAYPDLLKVVVGQDKILRSEVRNFS